MVKLGDLIQYLPDFPSQVTSRALAKRERPVAVVADPTGGGALQYSLPRQPNQQPIGLRVSNFSRGLPPLHDGVDGKLRGIRQLPEIEIAAIEPQVVDAVRHRTTQTLAEPRSLDAV